MTRAEPSFCFLSWAWGGGTWHPGRVWPQGRHTRLSPCVCMCASILCVLVARRRRVASEDHRKRLVSSIPVWRVMWAADRVISQQGQAPSEQYLNTLSALPRMEPRAGLFCWPVAMHGFTLVIQVLSSCCPVSISLLSVSVIMSGGKELLCWGVGFFCFLPLALYMGIEAPCEVPGSMWSATCWLCHLLGSPRSSPLSPE